MNPLFEFHSHPRKKYHKDPIKLGEVLLSCLESSHSNNPKVGSKITKRY